MTEPRSIAENLQTAIKFLTGSSDSARQDAESLLAHALEKSRSHLFAWPEKIIDTDQQQHFDRLIEQRRGGHPVAYLTGTREFWSQRLRVSKDTLIPRPETELLVEFAIAHIKMNPVQQILDLGTGSGAIALAIASECPGIKVYASDNSPAALSIARHNADRLRIENVIFVPGDWFVGLPPISFDLIVGNPPYIAECDPHLSRGDVAFEPLSALIGGSDGLESIRTIIATAPEFLPAGGSLAIEHGFDQGEAVRAIFRQYGFTDVRTRQDLNRLDRISFAALTPALD